MPIFTIEIEGRAIAVVSAETAEDVERIVSSDEFKADLMSLETAGQPVWDGTAEVHVRKASPVEAAAFERGFATAVREHDLEDSERDELMLFLVPVSDPTEDDGPERTLH